MIFVERLETGDTLTTEKDEQNLSDVKFGEMPVYVVVIDLAIDKEEAFLQAVQERLHARRLVI